MKTTIILAASLVLPFAADAQTSIGGTEMRDAVTHEALAQELGKVSLEDPMNRFEPSPGEDPSTLNRAADLLEESDVICFGGLATLVPKRAVIHTPPGVASRLAMQPEARLCDWLEFHSRNRGWITAIEVTRQQAEGHEPLPAGVLESMAKGQQLVVATYRGGPISVLPPKVADAGDPAQAAPQPQTPSAR